MTETMSFALPITALAASREALALAYEAAAVLGIAGLLAACAALLSRRARDKW
jgi:hypothetical protein